MLPQSPLLVTCPSPGVKAGFSTSREPEWCPMEISVCPAMGGVAESKSIAFGRALCLGAPSPCLQA